jgi:DNA-binding NtrC family response regulator
MYNILLVDDDPTWLSSHSEVIHSAFPEMFRIRFAANAAEALKLLDDMIPDIVITDLEMEKLQNKMYAGEFLIKKINEKHPALKIIIISGAPELDKIGERNTVAGVIPKWSLLNYPVHLKLLLSDIFDIKTEIC